MAPAATVIYAIGDVHGCADLLEDLLAKINLDASAYAADIDREIIFLGDYLDRGPDSRRVVDTILAVKSVPRLWKVTALKGNHEDALLQFLDHASFWPKWSRYGATETLLSYGVPPPPTGGGYEDWVATRIRLQAAIPPDHMDFFKTLDLSATRGDYFCVHAGVRPNVPLDEQDPRDLMTIREPFVRHRGRFEKVIVHGHTSEESVIGQHRIAADTRAYATGALTAVKLIGAERSLVQAHRIEATRTVQVRRR